MNEKIPKFLYHRTNHFKDIKGIFEKGAIIPSVQLTKRETKCGSHSNEFVSLTEGKCVKTGGALQITLDTEKILKKNEIFNIWKNIKEKDPRSIFLSELEWRCCNQVKIEKDDIKEIVLYKNYMTTIAPHFGKLPTYKREMTIQEKGLKDVGKTYNIPVRIVSMESKECNEDVRKEELKTLLEN